MKTETRTHVAILAALLMCLTAFAGCTDGATTAPTPGGSTPPVTTAPTNVPAPTDAALEIIEVSYLIPESTSIDFPYSFEDRPALKKIHDLALEQYGIDLTLETAIRSEYETVVNTRFASRGTLPDVVNNRYDAIKLAEVYENGLILALNDYPESIPNFMSWIDKDPYLLIANGNQDGKLLRFAEYFKNISHISLGLLVRKDWLDQVDLPLPTTDELKAAIKAFQDKDVNGNGKKDEVLAFTNYDYVNQVLSPAFGVQQMMSAIASWYPDADGNIYHTMLTDEARNYVTWISELYAEGLIWDAFLTYTQDDWSAFKLANRLAGNCERNWDGVLLPTELANSGITCEYLPVLPITDGEHERSIMLTNHGGAGGIMLTKDCDDPARVASFFDYFYTVEGHQLRYYGEIAPGGDYFVKDDTLIKSLGIEAPESGMVPTDKFNEEAAEIPELRAKLGLNTPVVMSAGINKPDELVAEYYIVFTPEVCGDAARFEYMLPVYEWMEQNGHFETGFVNANAAQAQVISDHADLFTYMDEQIKAFMTGVRSLDEWDDFVAECETMGMADVIAVQQERHDAYRAIIG